MDNVFFDMDGTIVSYCDRFYKMYKTAYLQIGLIPLSKEEWLEVRKNGEKYPDGVHEKLFPIFKKLFESSEYLKYDKIIPGMDKVIYSLQEKYPIKIVSFRSNNKNLIKQLKNLGIYNVETIIQGFSPDTPCDEKARMIQKVIPNPSGYIIGDTHFEILAAKKLGLISIACTWGDQSFETLQKYNPDFIVNEPEDILKIIQ